MSRLFLPSLFLAVFPVLGQPALHLKTRTITPQAVAVDLIDNPVLFGAGHLIIQFADPPSAEILASLSNLGITILGGIADNGLLVSLSQPVSLVGLGAVYAAPLDPSDKISPLISGGDVSAMNGYFLVEFHLDTDLNNARAVIQNLGIQLVENPDLNPQQLMIYVGNPAQVLPALAGLASADQVAYIFPASDELAKGIPSRAYAGALTTLGAVTQLIPTSGPGWGGPGQNPATVGYVFSALTNELAASATQAEIERAMAEWSKVVQVTWQQGSNATAPETVNILFASGAHADPFPFTPNGAVLAHTFYPAPPNPEPLAGDMHFNADETWNIGANTDVFTVVTN